MRTDNQTRRAIAELFEKAAQQLGLDGELEIHILRMPRHETSKNNRYRRLRLRHRTRAEIV